MKKVFMQFGSGLGPMSRSLPIAKSLAENGFQVKYFGFDNAKKYMEENGIYPLSDTYNIRDIAKGSSNPTWYSAEEFWEMIGYWDIDWFERKVNELIPLIQEFSPDYILSDLGIISCVAARLMDIPLVTITQSCYHPERPFDRLRWWEEPKKVTSSLLNKLNSLFAKNGKAQLNTFEEIFTGNLTVITSFPELDPLENTGTKNTHYVGPILWDPKELKNPEYENYFKSSGKKTLFCYTARFNDNVGESGELIFKIFVKIASRLDMNIVISTGSNDDQAKASNFIRENHLQTRNLRIIDWTPMVTAYGSSDLVIHHGGHGSCLGQFLYEIPGIIIPTHSEREYNARMMQKLGACELITRKYLNEESLFSTIQNISLQYDRYKDKTAYWHSHIHKANYGGEMAVTELIKKI